MADAPPPKKIIRTNRLILREARKPDIDAFYLELYSNEEVMRYW